MVTAPFIFGLHHLLSFLCIHLVTIGLEWLFMGDIVSFCMSKLKTVVETGEDLKEDDIDEPELDEAGQFLQNIKKLKAHPDRLHEELW